CAACAQAAIASAVDPSAEKIGAPESPLQAPAAFPVGSAAQIKTLDAGSRTAGGTLRSVPPQDQSPARAAPEPDRITAFPIAGASPSAIVAAAKLGGSGRAVRMRARSIERARA